MLANRPGLKRKFQSALAFTLVLWCAGAGCALGTYAHAAMRDHDLSQAQPVGMAMTGLSAAAGAHNCCKARHASQHVVSTRSLRSEPRAAGFEVAVPESSNSSNGTSCCPLTSGTLVGTARQSVRDDRASAGNSGDAPALVLADVAATPRALPLRLPNQNQTYLRGCAFLI